MKALKIACFASLIFFAGLVIKSSYTPFIKLELINRNYKILDDNDILGWEIRFHQWQKKHRPIAKVNYSSKEDLRSRCKSIMFNTFNGVESPDYIEARDWCTRPDTFKDKAKEDKYRLIGKNESEVWEARVEAYKGAIVNLNPINMMKDNEGSYLLKSDITVNKLHIWCDNKADKYWTRGDTEYGTYLVHCAIKQD